MWLVAWVWGLQRESHISQMHSACMLLMWNNIQHLLWKVLRGQFTIQCWQCERCEHCASWEKVFFTSQIQFLMSNFGQSDWLNADWCWWGSTQVELKSTPMSLWCLRHYAGASVILWTGLMSSLPYQNDWCRHWNKNVWSTCSLVSNPVLVILFYSRFYFRT